MDLSLKKIANQIQTRRFNVNSANSTKIRTFKANTNKLGYKNSNNKESSLENKFTN